MHSPLLPSKAEHFQPILLIENGFTGLAWDDKIVALIAIIMEH
jgi:hypothetical protein